jgi:hypothetical protein
MSRTRFPYARALLTSLSICSTLLIVGCSNSYQTSGTMVEESKETIEYRKKKLDSYKGGPPKAKGKAFSGKGKSAKS